MFTYIILPLYSLYFCTVGKDGQDPCKQASNKTLADGNYGFTAERVTRASDNGDSQRPIKTSTDAPLRESHPLGRRNASRGPAAGSVCKPTCSIHRNRVRSSGPGIDQTGPAATCLR